MSDFKRLKAANYYQQKARRAQTELRWHLSTLPGAVTGFIFSSFEFLIILTVLGIFAVTQINPAVLSAGTFELPNIQLPWMPNSSSGTSSGTAHSDTASVSETAPAANGTGLRKFRSITTLSKRQIGDSLLGAGRPEHFSSYFDYLAGRRDFLEPQTYRFFADYDRYSLGNNKSVYGLWIKNIQQRDRAIDLELTDAAGMRSIVFSYANAAVLDAFRWRDAPGVVSHELMVDDSGAVIHSFAFRDNSVMQISADRIAISER